MTQAELQELDRAVQLIIAVVRERSATPRTIADLVTERFSVDDAVARAAIWDLIDRGELHLDSALHLTAEVEAA